MTVHSIIFLLIVATLVALVARRLRVPYTVGLVAAGTGPGPGTCPHGRALTGHLLFTALLPPLLFEAALSLPWSELRRDAAPILTLATVGGDHLGAGRGGGMTLLLHWPWPAALVFGVLIAATDPVSVLATFKETGVSGRLRLLVEAESLLNDGVAAVLFALAVASAAGGARGGGTSGRALAAALGPLRSGASWSAASAAGLAVRAGGPLGGPPGGDGADGGGGLWLVPAGGPPRHVSGVLATLTAGLLMGNVGAMHGAESAVLPRAGPGGGAGLLGVRGVRRQLPDLPADRAGRCAASPSGRWAPGAPRRPSAWSGRAGRRPCTRCARCSRARAAPIPRRHQHVLFWGGLRGALALALALSLPPGLAYRDQVVIATFSVVAFSVIVQGIAMPLLLKRWSLLPPGEQRTSPDTGGVRTCGTRWVMRTPRWWGG